MISSLSLMATVQLAGVAVFAVSGALAAGRKSLDLLGVVVIATVTATGGGTLRDLLLDRPVFWVQQPQFLMVILAAALLTIPYVRLARPPEKFLQAADALGLALFSISGAQIALAAGCHGLVAVMMGTITGVVGGMLRDVLCNEIPLILRKGHIYATAAIAGCALFVLLRLFAADLDRDVAMGVGMFTIAALRLAAIAFGLSLPVFQLPDDRTR
ncbi:trimeric intracellular cation channel family protein [Panacagrimonas sp.]|uniref:trimeric intracellular cation channel family protein n=1 Tax=Panacagrimonas sp. TaxID=2480088 RepID=UPI003B52E604